eukprot:CAMPEP_0181315758 /NCGR_PEP_ID=MMETSP1101-20121128/15543_1 /TAXON_ID=46948 /ORGANISM="Rhodomonas abbreviata, Strain Caron Lab Isolate" /LENGTH=434 /DNA_ID=CAMNT_0023422981 /DNA_START=307 /DNA_END=1609 /DNA_ORIENTATION=-
MASLPESQAFLDQFDKCLPLCEKGDAVTVINALHTLNTITRGSIVQARELDPAGGKDFVCSFLIELELALELYISPSRKLGTIDGGLPALYSFGEDEISHLVDSPSPQTKLKVRRFLEALGVEPSPEFETRSVATTVTEFLRHQVKPSGLVPIPAPPTFSKGHRISWADQCSSGSDYSTDSDSSLPGLAEECSDDEFFAASEKPESAKDKEIEEERDEEIAEDEEAEEAEEGADNVKEEEEDNTAAAIFLWASPIKASHEVANCRGEEHADGSHRSHRSHCEQNNTNTARKNQKTSSNKVVDPNFKTRKCKNWEQAGSCPFGDRCSFAHGSTELRPADAAIFLLAAGGVTKGRQQQQQDDTRGGGGGGKKTGSYKTRMCKNLEATGGCKFGDGCMFAHSSEELRAMAGAVEFLVGLVSGTRPGTGPYCWRDSGV